MSEFKPGDMVECLEGNTTHPLYPHMPTAFRPLTTGAIYTVEKSGFAEFIELDGNSKIKPAVWLIGHHNARHGAYAPWRFRLIKPPATDISIFHKIVKEAMKTGKVTA